MKATVGTMMVALTCGSAPAEAPVQVLFPYSIAGRVVNYDGVAYEASDDKNTWSERTVYLIKSGRSRFYRVEMEQ